MYIEKIVYRFKKAFVTPMVFPIALDAFDIQQPRYFLDWSRWVVWLKVKTPPQPQPRASIKASRIEVHLWAMSFKSRKP